PVVSVVMAWARTLSTPIAYPTNVVTPTFSAWRRVNPGAARLLSSSCADITSPPGFEGGADPRRRRGLTRGVTCIKSYSSFKINWRVDAQVPEGREAVVRSRPAHTRVGGTECSLIRADSGRRTTKCRRP